MNRKDRILLSCILIGWALSTAATLAIGIFSIISSLPQNTAFAYAQSDDDLTRVISAQFPLEEECCPDDLVNLYDQIDRAFDLARADIELRKPAYEAANAMFAAAADDGITGYIVNSGYRSRDRQREIYAEEGHKGTVNRPGESEHEYGLTFDVTTATGLAFVDTEQFTWLSEHCWEHGFILRYPADKTELTGVPYESWHYRYVGKKAAKVMHEENWCLEEYAAFH